MRGCNKVVATALAALIPASAGYGAPRVVLISLDGATPRFVQAFMRDGTISRHEGLGLLAREGIAAERNVTVHPSLTAPGHIAIATGAIAARNDVPANTFHLVASPFNTNISGFAAPIGGYAHGGLAPSDAPTAEPLWLALRAAGKRVVTATWPGADGLDIRVPGRAGSPIVQHADRRTVDYTVPFGASGGLAPRGFVLDALSFVPAPAPTIAQLAAAGAISYSPIQQTPQPIDTFTVGGATFRILVAALDTTDDRAINYDTLVCFDATLAIPSGPFTLPSTGPAYVKAAVRRSARFYLEGSSNRAGTAFYASRLEPDLSVVHIARYAANFIPANAPVALDVNDINEHVGFWAPQPDFRIPERLSPGFGAFEERELEAIYADQVRTFIDYQTRVALRAIARNPDADLVMLYFEQPDGSSHQFLMVDPRQPSNPRDPTTIGPNQDPEKRARYWRHVRDAYRTANEAVQRVIQAVGTDRRGRPHANVIVVSDHGFAPFHTAVDLNAFLAAQGFDRAKVRAVTSGPAANFYISLLDREPNGTVSRTEYVALQAALVSALRAFVDTNPTYAGDRRAVRVFDQVFARPVPPAGDPDFGYGTDRFIGQDSGDVYAVLTPGYNFDGAQSPRVLRLGDDAVHGALFSVPNFYGAHGYDPAWREMSAIFYAAGPDICPGRLDRVRNIDIAPTILKLLDVPPAATVQGRPIELCRERGKTPRL